MLHHFPLFFRKELIAMTDLRVEERGPAATENRRQEVLTQGTDDVIDHAEARVGDGGSGSGVWFYTMPCAGIRYYTFRGNRRDIQIRREGGAHDGSKAG